MDKAKLIKALGVLSGASVLLLVARFIVFGDLEFWYLTWNLLLAALPLLFVWLLLQRLRTSSWVSWQNAALTLLWLGFLPNSFYLVTDFIHLAEVSSSTIVFDAVMMMTFTLTGLLLGFASILPLHRLLRQRLVPATADGLIAIVFALCSFAIYLGRYMRWNTWDILVNPAGLLFNVSDSLVNPRTGGEAWSTTLLFFAYISVLYIAIIQFVPIRVDSSKLTSGKKTLKKVK